MSHNQKETKWTVLTPIYWSLVVLLHFVLKRFTTGYEGNSSILWMAASVGYFILITLTSQSNHKPHQHEHPQSGAHQEPIQPQSNMTHPSTNMNHPQGNAPVNPDLTYQNADHPTDTLDDAANHPDQQ